MVNSEQRIGALRTASDLAAKGAAENRSTSEARIRDLEGQVVTSARAGGGTRTRDQSFTKALLYH